MTIGFDVVFEVSGSLSGLALALKQTRYGGQVVLGSWYTARRASPASSPLSNSNTTSNIDLCGLLALSSSLGLSFHRKNLSLRTVQVSRIPGQYSDRYSKERRMNVAWDLVRAIRPARLLDTDDSKVSRNTDKHRSANSNINTNTNNDTDKPPNNTTRAASKGIVDLCYISEVQRVYEELDRGETTTALFTGPAWDQRVD